MFKIVDNTLPKHFVNVLLASQLAQMSTVLSCGLLNRRLKLMLGP